MTTDSTSATNAASPLGSASSEGLGLVPERWYVLTTEGLATLCATEADARTVKAHADVAFPRHGPHRVALLGDLAAERERLRDVLLACQRHLACNAVTDELQQLYQRVRAEVERA